jgi:hypothetical protein
MVPGAGPNPRMVGRQAAPVPLVLSWGELSAMPRSRVFDQHRVPVFPGSPVRFSSQSRQVTGMVTRLVSPTEVEVQLPEMEPMVIAASRVTVTGGFPQDQRADWRRQ